MRPAHVIEIVTPKKVHLNGLWLGPRKPKRAIVWIHGLSSSAFGKASVIDGLVDGRTAVLTFNNRGHDKISSITNAKGKRIIAGGAHEVFTDCVDDIEGAIRFARKQGVRTIYLAGTSSGAQKSIYWASKKGKGIKGVILFAPISDYAYERMSVGKAVLGRIEKIARSYIKQGKEHELLPAGTLGWYYIVDAQRFISLYSGDSQEEIFTYWDPKRNPKTLRSVKLPILVLLAEKDEYGDRPAQKIGDWFAEHLKIGDEIVIVPRVGHSFKGAEKKVAKLIRGFMK